MKKHTIIGESILKTSAYQKRRAGSAGYAYLQMHHERYDGRGYPDGLKGEEILIEVQVTDRSL